MSLAGKRVVVTREEGPDGPLSTSLRARGAEPLLRATTTFEFAGAESAFGRALVDLERWDWLVVTSARTVRAIAGVRGFDGAQPRGLRIAAVGPGTQKAIEAQGWSVSVVPDSGGGDALVRLLQDRMNRPARVLLPTSRAATSEVADRLEELGCDVTAVVAYGPVPRELDADEWEQDLSPPGVDVITFTSPSAMEALEAGLPAPLMNRVRRLPAGAQGPTTASALRQHGWSTVVEASTTTFDGLSEELNRWFGAES